MDYQHWLKAAAARLTHSDSARRDAEILLGFVTGKARTFLMAFGETQLTPAQQQQLETLLARRERGEPVAYGGRARILVAAAVGFARNADPRPDTECLVELALARLPPQPCHFLDLGTGTGAIALALAGERPDCSAIGVDVQPEAVALAQHNAHKLKIDNVRFLQGSWFAPVAGNASR